MKTYLITGGCGFIGSNFVRFILEREPEATIINLDKLTYAGKFHNLDGISNSRYHFVHGDICDSELVAKLFNDHQFDGVVHFAAESHVDRSIDGPAEFVQTNIIGTLNLLEQSREYLNKEENLISGFSMFPPMRFMEPWEIKESFLSLRLMTPVHPILLPRRGRIT